MEIPESVLDWLLEKEDPSIRYRTLTELLDVPPVDVEAAGTRAAIPASRMAQKILSHVSEDGSWPWAGYDSLELGFGYLGELGLDSSHPVVSKAAQAYLSMQYVDDSFPNSYSLREAYPSPQRNDQSCYYALTLRGLVRLGYQVDPRLQRALAFTLSESRWDGGYYCSQVTARQDSKSCIRGSKNVLLLFSELPEVWETPQCRRLVDYFLERKIFFTRHDHNRFVRGHPQAYFPFHYRFGVLEPLYALSKMGLGNHPAVADAWGFLDEKKDESGRFRLDWTMPKCSFNPGKKGSPNKWVTLYAYLALKYKNDRYA